MKMTQTAVHWLLGLLFVSTSAMEKDDPKPFAKVELGPFVEDPFGAEDPDPFAVENRPIRCSFSDDEDGPGYIRGDAYIRGWMERGCSPFAPALFARSPLDEEDGPGSAVDDGILRRMAEERATIEETLIQTAEQRASRAERAITIIRGVLKQIADRDWDATVDQESSAEKAQEYGNLCQTCYVNRPETVIKSCRHLTQCHDCIQKLLRKAEELSQRAKCPNCSEPFGRDDTLRIDFGDSGR